MEAKKIQQINSKDILADRAVALVDQPIMKIV